MSETKRTPEEELQIEYSQNAYQAGDLAYRIKCFSEELTKRYEKMAEVNHRMAELTKTKEMSH